MYSGIHRAPSVRLHAIHAALLAALLGSAHAGEVPPPPTIQIKANPYFVLEGVSPAQKAITVEISQLPPAGITSSVVYTITNGTASSGTHYSPIAPTAMTGTLSFTSSSAQSQQLVVTINDNTADGIDRDFNITLSNPANAVLDPLRSSQSILIVDDDGGDLPSRILLGTADAYQCRFAGGNFSELVTNQVGFGATGAGDTNADGYEDFLISAHGNSSEPSGGYTHLLHGKVTRHQRNQIFFNWYSLPFLGSLDGVRFRGWSDRVSGAGDLNSDGMADFLIAWDQDHTLDGWAGLCHMLLGRRGGVADFILSDLALENTSSDWRGQRAYGLLYGHRLGASVSGVGDTDGDGVDEFIVGAPYGRPDPGNYLAGLGEVFLMRHPATTGSFIPIDALAAPPLLPEGGTIFGADWGDLAGYSASGIGDINGDGLDDFAIGAPYHDFYRAAPAPNYELWLDRAGAVYVVYGGFNGFAAGEHDREFDLSAAPLSGGSGRIDVIQGNQASATLGRNVSAIGDIDGDGYDDFLASVSQQYTAYIMYGTSNGVDLGYGYHWLNDASSNRTAITGVGAPSSSISYVGPAGDVDGDGYADLLIFEGNTSAESNQVLNTGAIRLVYGAYLRQKKGQSVALASLTPDKANPLQNASALLYADGPYLFAGNVSLGTAGDTDGDGRSDFLVGLPDFYFPLTATTPAQMASHGAAHLVYGSGPAASATYKAHVAAGNPPRRGIGLIGNRSNSIPYSRAWVDYPAGSGPGSGASLEAVTLYRTSGSITNLADKAAVCWKVESDRTGYSSRTITLKYTDAEIQGLLEDELAIYTSTSLSGPWTPAAGTARDLDVNRVTGAIPSGSTLYVALAREPYDPKVTFTVPTPSATEGTAPYNIEVSLTQRARGSAISVPYAILPGTAAQGFDYTAAAYSGTLVFPVGGARTLSIPVTLTDDSTLELGETFEVSVDDAPLPILGPVSAIVTIIDNDTFYVAPKPKIYEGHPPAEYVSVPSNATYTAVSDYASSDAEAVGQLDRIFTDTIDYFPGTSYTPSSTGTIRVHIGSRSSSASSGVPGPLLNRFTQVREGIIDWQKDESYLIYSPGAYQIYVPGNPIVSYYVISDTAMGRYYGVQSLKQILSQAKTVEPGLRFPKSFQIIDYPDYKERALYFFDGDAGSYFLTDDFASSCVNQTLVDAAMNQITGIGQNGKDLLDYLSMLKFNKLYIANHDQTVFSVGGEGICDNLMSPYKQPVGLPMFSWDPVNAEWVDHRGDSSLEYEYPANSGDEYDYATNYWTIYQDLYANARSRFIEPVPSYGFTSYDGIGKNGNLKYTREGVFCNRIPFDIVADGARNIAKPVDYWPCLNFSSSLLANGRFEEVSNVGSPTGVNYIPQSMVDGTYYNYIPSGSYSYAAATKKYQDVELSFWISTSPTSAATNSSVYQLPAFAGFTKPTLLDVGPPSIGVPFINPLGWQLAHMTFNTGELESHNLVFTAPSNSKLRVDGIKYVVKNLLLNASYANAVGSTIPMWSGNADNGRIAVETDPQGKRIALLRRSGPGTTSIQQNVLSHPLTVHYLTVEVKHEGLAATSKVLCEKIDTINGGEFGGKVESTVIGTGDRDWYQQEFAFTSSFQGSFLIRFRLEGTGSAWFRNAKLTSEKTTYACAGENFEGAILKPAAWQTSGVLASYQLTGDTSGEGFLAVQLESDTNGVIKQPVTLVPYSDYNVGMLHYPNATAHPPKVRVTNGSNATIHLANLQSTNDILGRWKQHESRFNAGDAASGTFALEPGAEPGRIFDAAFLVPSHLARNGSFEYPNPAGGFHTWSSAASSSCFTSDSANHVDGSASMLVTAPGNATSNDYFEVRQDIDVEKGMQYVAEALGMCDSVGTDSAGIRIVALNGSGTEVASLGVATMSGTQASWKKLAAAFYSGTYNKVRVYVGHKGPGTSSFDAVRVFKSNYLVNAGFENTGSQVGVGGNYWPSEDSQWAVLGVTTDSTAGNVVEGARSLKIDLSQRKVGEGSGAEYPRVLYSQRTSVLPWQTVELSFKYKATSVTRLKISATLGSEVEVLDPANPTSTFADPAGPWVGEVHSLQGSTAGWKTIKVVFNTGRNVIIYPSFTIERFPIKPYSDLAWSGTIWIDDVRLTPIATELPGHELGFRFASGTGERGGVLNSFDGRRFHVLTESGSVLQEGTDYEVNLYSTGLVRDSTYGRDRSRDWYDIEALPGGALQPGDRVYISWNQDYNREDGVGAPCYQSPEYLSLIEAIVTEAADPSRLALTTVHVGGDDVIMTNLDSRSISHGLRDSQQLADAYDKIRTLLEPGVKVEAWLDRLNRFHDGGGVRYPRPDRVSARAEHYRALDHVDPDLTFVEWIYNHRQLPGIASMTALEMERKGQSWWGIGGYTDFSDWQEEDPQYHGDTPYDWLKDSRPHSLVKGTGFWMARTFARFDKSTDPFKDPPYEMKRKWQGLLCAIEAGWNLNGYKDSADTDDLIINELPYDPVMMNGTFGNMGSSRK